MKYNAPNSPRIALRKSTRTFRIAFVSSLTLIFALLATSVAYMAPGAIFTTDSACSGVDLNIYGSKDDVYLNGGPQGGGPGLPDGNYYAQVTTPDGTQLGYTTTASVVVLPSGSFQQCYNLSTILVKTSDATPGYDSTSNPGGEYKVWVSKDPTFANSESKTDNFKVKETPNPPQGLLKVEKFYDADASGTLTAGDSPILGWEVRVGAQDTFSSTYDSKITPASSVVDPGCYTAQEGDATNWIHTNAKIQSAAVADGGTTTISFGNVCLGPGGGLTLGFWSNKNGQSLVDAGDLAALGVLNLRDGAGNHFPGANPAAPTYATYRSWLLSATATNMAYMLSAQLSAMKLNVLNGKVSGGAIVYAPGTGLNGNDFATINQLMAAADAELGLHGNTVSGGPGDAFRAYQEALKNALDKANNNLNFVQSAAQCGVASDGTLSGAIFSFDDTVSAPACP